MILVQKTLWGPDEYLGAVRQKLRQLSRSNPEAFADERSCDIEYWTVFENLKGVLGDRYEDFVDFYNRCTSPSTLSRARRLIKERNNGH